MKIRLVDCGHIAGFHDAEGALLEVPGPAAEYRIQGAHMSLVVEVFRHKRSHAIDVDGEAHFLDAPEYAPSRTEWVSAP